MKLLARKTKVTPANLAEWISRLRYQLAACHNLESEMLAAVDARHFRQRQSAIRKQLAALNQTA